MKIIQLNFLIIAKSKKLGNLTIQNRIHRHTAIEKLHHVVHEYACDQEGCNAPKPNYIGYTSCTLYDRSGMHTQNGSIKRHLIVVKISFDHAVNVKY